MSLTGGELNLLNGNQGISAPYRSVPVMKLIREHKPKTKNELVELIEYHYKNKCSCGIVSQGTVEDFGRNLYESQIKQWGKYKYSLEECKRWEYDLFITQSLKGNLIEDKTKSMISIQLPMLEVIDASAELDSEYRIDLVVKKSGKEVCGIQIKPHTFFHMRKNVVTFNYVANISWGKPVFYLIYNERDDFTNLQDIVVKIRETAG